MARHGHQEPGSVGCLRFSMVEKAKKTTLYWAIVFWALGQESSLCILILTRNFERGTAILKNTSFQRV